MTQINYTEKPAIGLPGTLRNGRDHDITTHWIEGSGVAAGRAVIAGTAAHQCKVPTAAFTTTFLGIVSHEPLETQAVNDAIPAGKQWRVVREGVVLVAYEPDTVPTPNTPAYARHTANGAGKLTLGAIRANADTSNASAIPGGMFRQVFQSQGLVELELAGTVN